MPRPPLDTILAVTAHLIDCTDRHRLIQPDAFLALAECSHDIFHGMFFVMPLSRSGGWNFVNRYAAKIARDGSVVLTCSAYATRYETRLRLGGDERRLRQFAVARAFESQDEANEWLRTVEI